MCMAFDALKSILIMVFETLIKSKFQGMYWCAHKTTTLTSIQHTVPPTSAYVIYEWYLILLFFFINHSPIDYFFAYVFLFQKEKKMYLHCNSTLSYSKMGILNLIIFRM